MAVRELHTGRIVVTTICAEAFNRGRVVEAVYVDFGVRYCPDHDDPADPIGDCLETYRAQSQMARWDARRAWRMWRRWRKAVA